MSKISFAKTGTRTMYLIQNSSGATLSSYLNEETRDERLSYLRQRYPKTEYLTKTVTK